MTVWVVYNVNGGVVAVYANESDAYRKTGESRAYSKVEMNVVSSRGALRGI